MSSSSPPSSEDPYRSRVRSLGHFLSTIHFFPERSTSKVKELRESRCSGVATKLRILSYNVNFGLDGRSWSGRTIQQAVRRSHADIVVLQETQHTFEEAFKENLGKIYPYQYWRPALAAGGAAFLSKYPFEDVSVLNHRGAVEGSWFETIVAHINYPLSKLPQTQEEGSTGNNAYQSLLIANLHLRPPIDDGGNADLSTLGRTNDIRLGEVKHIVAELQDIYGLDFNAHRSECKSADGERDATSRVSPSHALFMVGDWNEPEHMPAMRWAKEEMGNEGGASSTNTAHRENVAIGHGKSTGAAARFVDAVEQHVPPEVETHRWPLVVRPPLFNIWMKNRLDHVLYDSCVFTALDCVVMSGYATGASDHQPVLAAFGLANNQGA